jgi:hypothetical protein
MEEKADLQQEYPGIETPLKARVFKLLDQNLTLKPMEICEKLCCSYKIHGSTVRQYKREWKGKTEIEISSSDQNQDYDLKSSEKVVGQLYPVLKAADGEILDGCHRVQSDPSWKAIVLETINTPEEKLLARLIANFHRRSVPTEEKSAWLNQLAQIYRNNGFKIEGERERAQGPNEIARKICDVTGIGYRTVMEYLEPTFKQDGHRRLDPEQHHAYKEPEEIIFNHLKAGKSPTWANGVIERFKQQHEQELLKSPIFRKEILNKISRTLSTLQAGNRAGSCYHSRKELAEKELARLANERKEGYEQLPDLYETFIQECPNCLCSKCDHADMCIERVKPGD